MYDFSLFCHLLFLVMHKYVYVFSYYFFFCCHAITSELLGELGQFYMRNGSRSRLSDEVRESVLQHLEAVRAALPEEPKSLLGL
jgi:hypothetical protein